MPKRIELAAAAEKTAARTVGESLSPSVPISVGKSVGNSVRNSVGNSVRKPVRRTNADMSAQTKAGILKATIASLAEHGYAGTTMAGIATRVGVSRAALVYHFDSKNTLMTAVINAIYDEMAAMYLAAAHASLTPQERMLAVVEVSFKFTTSLSQMAQIELLLAARRDPEFRVLVAPAIEARDHGFEAAWQRLTAELPGSLERLALVRDFAVSVFRGITISRSLKHDDATYERQLTLLRKLLIDAM